MAQIEQIKAEIERRLKANGSYDEVGDSAWHYDQGMVDAYSSILSFIESLEKERIYTIEREVKLHPVVASNVGLTTFSIEVELKPSEIAMLAMSKSVKLVIR